MVDYYIGEQCEKTLMSQGRTLSGRQKQALINDFHRRKREPDFDDATEEHVMTLHGPGGVDVPLTDIEVSEAFEKAMDGPWSKFAGALQSQAQLNNIHTLQVIVSGGTSRSQAVKDGVTMLCRSCEYEDPIFADELTMHIGARYPFVFHPPFYSFISVFLCNLTIELTRIDMQVSERRQGGRVRDGKQLDRSRVH